MMKSLPLLLVVMISQAHVSYGQLPPYEDLYCGDKNCYDLLGVTRDSEKAEIAKSYRKLAKLWHPDRFQDAQEKKDAETMFMKIAAGYEVLREEESRTEYDYMLDHPEEMFGNYYRYYKRRLSPKVDVEYVILWLITIVSAVQYYSTWYNFEQAINNLATVPKYRYQALEIVKSKGLLPQKEKGVSKEEMKKREELAVREAIAEKMDSCGGYQKPQVQDILWVQLILLPRTAYRWAAFYLIWVWKFGIKREEYGEEEKQYVMRRNLGLTERQWGAVGEKEMAVYVDRELWKKEEWGVWKEEQAEEERKRKAESGRSKQERRWEKKGDNRMTFDENYDW